MRGVWQAELTPEVTAHSATSEFVDLYRSHYARLVRALIVAGAPTPAAAEDAAQEAFARTFRHWKKVRTGSNPRGYVTTAAFRLLRRRRGAPHDLTPDDDAADATSVPGPESGVVLNVSVEEALGAMPGRRRACAALCLYLELPVEDAAAVLGVAQSTVRVQVHRARRDLRAALGEPLRPSPSPG